MPRRSSNYAGEAFGFDLSAGTFGDEGTETKSVLAEYFPELKIRTAAKDIRGGRLGRSAKQESSEVNYVQKREEAPINITNAPVFNGIPAPSTPTPTPQPTPEPTPQAPKVTYTDPGDKGYFGMLDYEELARQNVPQEEIKKYATEAQYGVGPKAAELLGVKPYTETQGVTTKAPPIAAPKQALRLEDVPDLGDTGWFGQKDYDWMTEKGYTTEQIKQQAGSAKYGVGDTIADLLSVAKGAKYNYTDPGDKGAFGQKDYDELAAQGVSEGEMQRIARSMTVGPAIKQRWGW